MMIRISEFLIGPLSLLLRAVGVVPAAALSFLLGASISRFGWMEAGRDSQAIFAPQR